MPYTENRVTDIYAAYGQCRNGWAVLCDAQGPDDVLYIYRAKQWGKSISQNPTSLSWNGLSWCYTWIKQRPWENLLCVDVYCFPNSWIKNEHCSPEGLLWSCRFFSNLYLLFTFHTLCLFYIQPLWNPPMTAGNISKDKLTLTGTSTDFESHAKQLNVTQKV